VTIQNEGQFLLAQVLIASPRGTGYAHVDQPYEDLSVHHASPYEAIAWQFVVTNEGATPVFATEVDATRPADRMAPDVTWSSSGVQRLGSGSSRCGGTGESWGGTAPTVEFISVCPS